MDFLIKQYATLPKFQIEIIKDGRSDYNSIDELLSSNVLLSLKNIDTNEIIGYDYVSDEVNE